MFRAVQDLLEWRATLILCGRYEDLARTYILPKVVFLEGIRAIANTTEDVVHMVDRLAQGLHARGVVRLVPTISALELPRDGRFRGWVRWSEIATDPAQDSSSEAIYYFRETASGLQTEMLDFSKVSMPEFKYLQPSRAMAR